MSEQNLGLQDELSTLNKLLKTTLEAYSEYLEDIDFIEVLSVLLPDDWTLADLRRVGNATITIAAHSRQAVLMDAAEAEARGAHLCSDHLEAVATIINDFMKKLREAFTATKGGREAW